MKKKRSKNGWDSEDSDELIKNAKVWKKRKRIYYHVDPMKREQLI